MIKTLQLNLGTLADPPAYTTGWYQDPNTGQYYYYDASIKQWYIYAAGVLSPLTIAWESAPKVVSIAAGDTLRIEYSYKYSGPAVSVTEYAAIGVYGALGFNDQAHNSKSYSWSITSTPTERRSSIDILVPSNVAEDWNDIYAKVTGGGKELGLGYENALNILAVEGEFAEFTIVDYAKV